MTDQPSNYAADVECAIGLNVGGDRTDGVHAARDAVLAVRDREMEQLRDERDRYFHFACAARGASGAPDFPDLTDTILALQDRAERAEATLREVLSRFTEHGHPGSPCLRTPWLNVETVSRWRAALGQAQQPTTEAGK